MIQTTHKQLDWMDVVSKRGSSIQHCYSLLFRQEIWILAYQQTYHKRITESALQEINSYIFKLKKMFHQLIKKNYTFYLGHNLLENRLLIEVIGIILKKIYQPLFDANGIKNCELETMQWIKNIKKKVTWFYSGQFSLTPSDINRLLMNQLRYKLDDEAFISLIYYIFKRVANKISKTPYTFNSFYYLLVDIAFLEWDKLMSFSPGKQQDINEKSYEVRPCLYVRYKQHFICGYHTSKQMAKKHLEANLQKIKTPLYHPRSKWYHWQKPLTFLDYNVTFQPKKDPSIQLSKAATSRLLALYANVTNSTILHRPSLVHKTEFEIIRMFNKELIQMAERYYFVDNFYVLDKIHYFAKSSLIKTIASKRKTTSKKVTLELKKNPYHRLGIYTKKNGKDSWYGFISFKELRTIQSNKKRIL